MVSGCDVVDVFQELIRVEAGAETGQRYFSPLCENGRRADERKRERESKKKTDRHRERERPHLSTQTAIRDPDSASELSYSPPFLLSRDPPEKYLARAREREREQTANRELQTQSASPHILHRFSPVEIHQRST
jgi:hypothetical protein